MAFTIGFHKLTKTALLHTLISFNIYYANFEYDPQPHKDTTQRSDLDFFFLVILIFSSLLLQRKISLTARADPGTKEQTAAPFHH